MTLAEVTIIVMAKYPEAGKVKTRLQSAVSPAHAAAVHRVFLQHVVRRAGELAPKQVIVCFDPPGAGEAMRELLGDVQLLAQSCGDLGARLAAAKEAVEGPVLFLGVDAPDVPGSAIHAAAELLARVDVVLGPTRDGGYWCLGLRHTDDVKPLLREIPWSSGGEYDHTLDAAGLLGYTTAAAPPWEDVDHPADLARLIQRLEQSSNCDDKVLLQALRACLPPAGAVR
jgi:uncharacterized protein